MLPKLPNSKKTGVKKSYLQKMPTVAKLENKKLKQNSSLIKLVIKNK
jgi:hypothetical protein